MAQPLFDGHPLEEYLQVSGEASEPMPGGIPDISFQPYLTGHTSTSKNSKRMEKLCFLIFDILESLGSLFSSDPMSLRAQAFAERFKYGVISSSLLSPPLVVESHRRGLSPSIPGKLSGDHSRTSSTADSTMTDVSLSIPPEPETRIWPVTLSFTVGVAALSAQLYFFSLLLLAATLYYMRVHRLDVRSKPDVMTPSLLALQHLVSAGRLWDGVVNDAFTMLENEERSIFYGPVSPRMTSSLLRVALSTSLLTTRTQCDNVRQLLSAISSPSALVQLAEMYAPPSPVKPTFAPTSDAHRPLSHPGVSPRATPQADRMRKRSTWNGSYASLALAGTPPPFQLAQRREKRRSDLSALLGTTSPTPARTRPRNAPSSPPQLLTDVSEEEDAMVTAESSLVGDEEEHFFGATALGLYRNRVQGGLRALELSQRSTPSSLARGNSTKCRTTMSPGSKYTSMHTSRHPFSLSSLRQSLQNALASKRFACSHLLALRFEDDDEAYWEDVRSVMSLLTSTLVGASSRLSEALDEVEEQHLKVDDTASESASGIHTPSSLASPPPVRPRPLLLSQTTEQIGSFAPTPSHLVRFASHVDAISTALDDAREQLAQCVASLKEDQMMHSPGHSSHPSTSSSGDVPLTAAGAGPGTLGEPSEHPAIQAYERLRRELGLALRECERGRERLVYLVTPPTPSTDDEIPIPDGGAAGKSPPVPDAEDGSPPSVLPQTVDDDDVHLTVVSPSGEAVHYSPDLDPIPSVEDHTYLPLPGIEQVFEADSGAVGAFTRERSRLSREERIRLVKAERERVRTSTSADERVSGRGHDPCPPDDGDDSGCSLPLHARWGPSDDVVQELKDVIWRVGQRRQKRSAGSSPPLVVPRPAQPEVPASSVVLVSAQGQGQTDAR